MFLVTEYDDSLAIEHKVPASSIRKIYLTEGSSPILNKAPTLFGRPIHYVYLGYNLRSVETFVNSLEGDTSNIFLISPISRWGLYSVKLKYIDGLQVSNQFDTQESKVDLVANLTNLNKTKSKKVLKLLKYNFAAVESNLDLLRWCAKTNSDIETALASVEKYSYTDILFYLCGSNKHTRQQFVRTLAKYRHGKKHILKYLKDMLDDYIDWKLDSVDPPKSNAYTLQKLSMFLYLEDAMSLRYALNNVNSLTDLLKGES